MKLVIIIFLVFVTLIGVICSLSFFAPLFPTWTGFSEFIPNQSVYGYNRAKTLWDWISLLLVPSTLVIISFLFNKSLKDTEMAIANQRYEETRQIEIDRQRETTLQTYLDQVTDIIYKMESDAGLTRNNNRLLNKIITIKTITALRKLDPARIDILIGFLKD